MDPLFSSYNNLGSRLPKNDATITRKKEDATVKLACVADFWGESICRLSWKVFADFGGNNYTDSERNPEFHRLWLLLVSKL